MSTVWHDLRYAARLLRQAPGFTSIAVAVLAIGIGANSAIFSFFDVVLLRPLPFPHPERLTALWEHPPGFEHNSVAPLNFLDWSEQNQVFESLAGVSGGSRTLTSATTSAEKIAGQSVTTSFFDVLQVKPIAGRTFTTEDSRLKSKVVVLSERLWHTRFGSNPNIIGSPLILDGDVFQVIGIVPAGFQIFYKSDMWTPFYPKRTPEQRAQHYLLVIGRLKDGVSLEHARAGMQPIAANIARLFPATNKGWTVTVESFRQALIDPDLRTTSLMLAGVSGLVLLMACANIANLMLARGIERSREIAVRESLGGSRARIVRQLLTESLLLSALGGFAGTLLAWLIVRSAPAWLPAGTLPVVLSLSFNARVTAFSVLATLLTGIVFGLAPAWQASRVPLADALRAGGRTLTGATGLFRAALAATEIGFAVMLLAGASLLLRTILSLQTVDPGYHGDRVLTMYVSVPLKKYPTQQDALHFFQAAETEIAALPGVVSVGMGTSLPTDGWEIGQGFSIVGAPPVAEADQPAAHYQIVSKDYFETLGIPFLQGRPFTARDNAASTQVCIVNEEFVRRYLTGRSPIGRRISVEAMDPHGPVAVAREVVGVINQVKVEGLAERKNALEIYVPMAQNPWYDVSLAVRTAGESPSLAAMVKQAIARVDKDQAVTRVRSMDEVAAQSVTRPRFRAWLVGAFAALALVLAAFGIFGVLAFLVSQRTREFGIRIALGAQAADVLRLVFGGGLKIISIGIALGLAGAVVLTRSLATLLYGVKPTDPFTFVAAPALLALVALVAVAIPALRATRVDPANTLRQD